MPRLKKIIPALVSASVLIFALILPYFLFKNYDKRLLGNVYTEKFTDPSSVKIDELDTKSRLEIIFGYSNKSNIVRTDKNEAETPEKTESNINATLNEIKKMQEIGAFPDINIEDKDVTLTYSISQTYTDLLSMGKYVKVNSLAFSCKNGSIQILKDNETNKIYQYEVMTAESLENLNIPNIAKNLSDYLGIQLANLSYPNENPERFTTEDRKIKYDMYLSDNLLSVKISGIS